MLMILDIWSSLAAEAHRRLPASSVDAHRKCWTDIIRKLDAALWRNLGVSR